MPPIQRVNKELDQCVSTVAATSDKDAMLTLIRPHSATVMLSAICHAAEMGLRLFWGIKVKLVDIMSARGFTGTSTDDNYMSANRNRTVAMKVHRK